MGVSPATSRLILSCRVWAEVTRSREDGGLSGSPLGERWELEEFSGTGFGGGGIATELGIRGLGVFKDGLCFPPGVSTPSGWLTGRDAARALGVVKGDSGGREWDSIVRLGDADGGRREGSLAGDSCATGREFSCFAVKPRYLDALEPDVI